MSPPNLAIPVHLNGTATPVDRPDQHGRLYALDVLRFGAASMVVAFHVVPQASLVFGVDPDAYFGHLVAQGSRYGWMGVPLFFMISGFVICMSSWGRPLSAFVTSRAARLYPAYILAVLVAALISTASPNPSFGPPSLVQVGVNLTMLQGLAGVPDLDTVYWTLLVEVKFYLLFAALVWAGVTYRRVVAFSGLWLVGGLLAEVSGTRLLVELLVPQWAPFFVAGIVLYLMHRFGPTLLLWLMLAGSVAFCARSVQRWTERVAAAEGPVDPRVALAVFAVCLLLMLAVALGWTRGVRWRGLTTVGALTYPLYLLHFHVAFLALRHGHGWLPDWLLLTVVLAGVVALAYAVHRLVERPGSRLLRRGLQRSFDQMRTR
ncbi:acyltransferase family protein [Micromonospora sp. URMC 103]|uniref:acyltransferase family protein n=1 Tax=Micromonospora sp. URMC 103 TaxID=3423406 RepID=UPI003F19EDA0